MEDYLEAIYHQIHDKGYSGTRDLSERLQVRPASVSIMLRRLDRDGYLVHESYRGTRLTERGIKVAESVISRHRIISEFLSMIGVEDKEAQRDAEGIEHHVQPITIHRIERLVEFLRKNRKCLDALENHLGF